MHKKNVVMALVALLFGGALTAVRALERQQQADTESIMLDLNKVKLGTLSTEDDKKKYIYTIQLEKARVMLGQFSEPVLS